MTFNANVFVKGNLTENHFYGSNSRKSPEVSVDTEIVEVMDDYSQSVLRNYLAHPEHVNRTLTWLHLMIDSQKEPAMRLKPIRTLFVSKVFSAPIPHSVFVAEFVDIKQNLYSKYTSMSSPYEDSELKTLSDAYESFDFENYTYQHR